MTDNPVGTPMMHTCDYQVTINNNTDLSQRLHQHHNISMPLSLTSQSQRQAMVSAFYVDARDELLVLAKAGDKQHGALFHFNCFLQTY